MVDRSGILPGSPLVLSLASIRYAPWPTVAKFINEIHEELRDTFPLIQQMYVQQVSLGGVSEQTSLWMLISADRTKSLQITQDQILVATTDYTRYEEFEKLVGAVLGALIARMKFMHFMNIGVRYVDHVRPVAGEALSLYLCPALFAPQFAGMNAMGGVTYAAYEVNGVELRVRCTTQPGLPAMPEDLVAFLAMVNPSPGQFQIKQLGFGECTMDLDAVLQLGVPSRIEDGEIILSKLNQLHNTANDFFRRQGVFTDHAFEVWKRS